MGTWSLAVTDFAVPSPRLGDIEKYTGQGKTSVRAQKMHSQIQAKHSLESTFYHSEFDIKQIVGKSSYHFKLCGKIDGFWSEPNSRIEEIKTSMDVPALLHTLKDSFFTHPYWLQLQTYGYMYWLQKNTIPQLNLLIVCLRTEKQWSLAVKLDIELYEEWCDKRINELINEINLYQNQSQRRKTLCKQVNFPFVTIRTTQQQLMAAIKKDIKNKVSSLIQAPTGTGKTLAVLLPILKESLRRGQRTVYVVPKNSQQAIVNDAVEQLSKQAAPINSIILTAKAKLCLNTEILCHSNHCKFAKNHFTKVHEHQLISKANQQDHLTKAFFLDQGSTYEICPYALQMDSLATRDVVIADYNYVFSPGIASDNLIGAHFSVRAKANLIIDEAHNLVDRSISMYSATLSVTQLSTLTISSKLPHSQIKSFKRAINECCTLIRKCASGKKGDLNPVILPFHLFLQQEERLNQLFADYLMSEQPLELGEGWFSLIRLWSEFTGKAEHLETQAKVFFCVYEASMEAVRIICCDASYFLSKQYIPFKHIVACSATLKPFHYYQHFLGFSIATSTHEFASPFDQTRRKIMLIPQISTKYVDKQRHYNRMIEAVQRITAVKPGNYLLFFPSFAFLEAIYTLFPSTRHTLIRQTHSMRTEHVEELLQQLQSSDQHHLLFAVQGGVFSEGIDYKGDLAIGTFIFGPPLPVMDGVRKLMQQYYVKNHPQGQAYATIYPAMAKSIQAAGRVIRTEQDKGIIVLFDNRFLHPTYQQCMPRDWFIHDAQECVSQSIIGEVENFWCESNNIKCLQ